MLIKNLFAVSAYVCLWMSTVTKYTYLPTPELINTTILIFKHEYNKNFIRSTTFNMRASYIFTDIKKFNIIEIFIGISTYILVAIMLYKSTKNTDLYFICLH